MAAWWIETSDEEHAVSTVIAGPTRPSANATLPTAVEAVTPVAR